MLEPHALTPQRIDRVDLEDRVVDHDAANHDQSDHRHQVQRLPECPEDDECPEEVDDDLREDDPWLDERFELCGQDEEQQQQGDGKHPGELPHYAAVRKIAAAEAHLEMPVLRHTAPDRADDGRDILGPGREVERVIVTLGPGHDMFQVAGHCLAHQDADRDFSLGGMDERIAEQIVQAAQVVADHDRQRFVARGNREKRILVERIAQRGYEVVVGHAVQRHPVGLCDVENVLLHGDRRDFLPRQRIPYAAEQPLQLFRVGTAPGRRTQACGEHGFPLGEDHVEYVARNAERTAGRRGVRRQIAADGILNGCHVVRFMALEVNRGLGYPVLLGMRKDELLDARHDRGLKDAIPQRGDEVFRPAGVLLGRDAVVPIDAD